MEWMQTAADITLVHFSHMKNQMIFKLTKKSQSHMIRVVFKYILRWHRDSDTDSRFSVPESAKSVITNTIPIDKGK